MRKERRRGLSLLLVLVMLLGLLPGTAWGADAPIGSVTFSIETKTINGEYMVDPMEEELYPGDTVYTILSRIAGEKGISVEGAETGYVTKIGAFGSYTESEYGLESGWMALLNNDYETWPLPALKDGDIIRFCYTYKTYGHDIDLIDLVEQLDGRVASASEYTGANQSEVSSALVAANEKLNEIDGFASNQAYIDSLGTMVYGPGSDAVKIQQLINRLDIVLGGGKYVPVEDVDIEVLDESGNIATEYVAGRNYQLRAVYDPADASWQNGNWALVTGMGADATVSADGTLAITGINDDLYGSHMLTIQYWHPEAASGCFTQVLPGIKAPQTPADHVNVAANQLTWDTIKGNNTSSYSVTVSLTLPGQLAVEEKTVAVSWSCDDTTGAVSVWGNTAAVVRPAAQDVSCTLTAALSCDGASVTKEFPITVKAEGVSEDKESVVTYGDLLTTIAAGYTASADPWVVLEMAAYNGSSVKAESGYAAQSAAAAVLADAAIGQAADVSPLSGVDVSGAYAIYSVPYLSLAYQAAGREGTDAHSPEALKKVMTDYLNALGESSDVEAVTPALAALAPYYSTDDAVKSAVDKGVAWLSQHQNSDGTFSSYGTSNANTTALAVVDLAALGIDAHTDSRFIKNNKSAVEGLFSFALADHSGFGYKGNVTRNDLATEQGFRALVAYARMKANDKAYNIYLEAKDSADTVPAPNITATVKPDGGGSGSGGSSRVEVRTASIPTPTTPQATPTCWGAAGV